MNPDEMPQWWRALLREEMARRRRAGWWIAGVLAGWCLVFGAAVYLTW
jgi:hypothetical protein